MAEVIRINDNSWRIDEGFVRYFLLEGKDFALMVDSGASSPDAKKIAEGLTDLPVKLINTHSDPDHISGNEAFESFWMHPADEAYYREKGGKRELLPVKDGEVIDLGGRQLEVIHVPGHTPGSITLLDKEQRCVIGGDPVQEGGRIFMFGPTRCMKVYPAGLEHLMERGDEFDSVYPSHGKLCVDKSVIPALIEGAKAVMEGRAAPFNEEMRGIPISVYDGGPSKFLCGRKE